MSRIKILSPEVINKIAAGEVIERPASVLKELMENSIDAKSKVIKVKISEAGKKLIAVEDDGCGMKHDDALLSIERHATSKISNIEDIEKITTLGFRGEALASISAVSRMKLTTRTDECETGTEIIVSGGKLLAVNEVSCPKGTMVEVRSLFFNIPARKKFLKSDNIELYHLKRIFITNALARPGIHMTMNIDGKDIFTFTATKNIEMRISDIFSLNYSEYFKFSKISIGTITVIGFFGLPLHIRSDRSEQFIFINNRPIINPVIYDALYEVYKTAVPKNRYPRVVLFIEMPPEEVDVNVHPTKKEVKFKNPDNVYNAIIKAAAEAFKSIKIKEPIKYLTNYKENNMDIPKESKTYNIPILFEHIEEHPVNIPPIEKTFPKWKNFSIIGKLKDRYLLFETENGYVILDPHAAHERILFESYIDNAKKHSIVTQQLLVPEVLELNLKEYSVLEKYSETIKQMGFSFSFIGSNAIMIDGLPSILTNCQARNIFEEIIATLSNLAVEEKAYENIIQNKIILAACKGAVKSNYKFNESELKNMIELLASCKMPYTCPHGRRIFIYTSFNELDHLFGRT